MIALYRSPNRVWHVADGDAPACGAPADGERREYVNEVAGMAHIRAENHMRCKDCAPLGVPMTQNDAYILLFGEGLTGPQARSEVALARRGKGARLTYTLGVYRAILPA